MTFEHRPGSFILFKADKDGNEKRPDYTGFGKDLQDNEIEVAAWIRDGKSGKKFMSCSFKIKGQQTSKPQPTSTRTPAPKDGGMDIDDDIPFANPYAGGMWRVV